MPDLNEEIQANILEAQVFSRKHLVLELDFSLGSLEELESHIDTVDYAIPGGKSEDNLRMLTRVWGTYLGECIRRQIGGKWVHEQGDESLKLTLIVDEKTWDPLEQVKQRLNSGEAFNVAAYAKSAYASG